MLKLAPQIACLYKDTLWVAFWLVVQEDERQLKEYKFLDMIIRLVNSRAL